MKLKMISAAALAAAAIVSGPAGAQSLNCQNAKTDDDKITCYYNESIPLRILNEEQAHGRLISMIGGYVGADVLHISRGKLVQTGEIPFPGCRAVALPVWVFVWDGKQNKAVSGWGRLYMSITGVWMATDPCDPDTPDGAGK